MAEPTATTEERSLADALGSIPVFPLPRVVLFPGAVLPLHVFEPRYRTMLRDCLDSHRALVIAHQEPNGSEHGIARVAGAGFVVEHQALPDGRSNIIVRGTARLRLDEIVDEDLPRYPYLRARATILRDLEIDVGDARRAALVAAATMFAAEVKKHDPTFTFHAPQATDAGQIADGCAFSLVVDAHARQAILEELDPRRRADMVMSQLALQQSAMLRDAPGRVLN